jgi:hypothetical protein
MLGAHAHNENAKAIKHAESRWLRKGFNNAV